MYEPRLFFFDYFFAVADAVWLLFFFVFGHVQLLLCKVWRLCSDLKTEET
jgi:hypothetical protein